MTGSTDDLPVLDPRPDGLWSAVTATTAVARGAGALITTPTDERVIADGGFEFLVRTVIGLPRKPGHATFATPATVANSANSATSTTSAISAAAAESRNPFLPYEKALFVTDVGPRHVCLLNKFNIVPYHLLLVTRHFESQDTMLSLGDFLAWFECLAGFPSLGFYNGGRLAGASQPHKHMQLVPLPLSNRYPRATLVDHFTSEARGDETIRVLPRLPIRHRFAGLDRSGGGGASIDARRAWNVYGRMIGELGLGCVGTGDDRARGPYNLLITRDWLLVVPRRKECHETMSLNALAFAGAFLARGDDESELIVHASPIGLWRSVGFPAGGSIAGDGLSQGRE